MKAYVHSVETLGLLDGPGIRTVFFLKGCPLACKYCHNPDTQAFGGGDLYQVEDILAIARKNRSYYDATGGGVTFSGGEPLMQGDFLLACIKALKAEGFHVTLDTSGYGQPNTMGEIIDLVDLILLDVKHYDDLGYKDLIGVPMRGILDFIELLKQYDTPVWVRHVMVPTYTDTQEAMDKFMLLIKDFKNWVDKIEILPYHKLGIDKYSQLGMVDPLSHLSEMDEAIAKDFELSINQVLTQLKKE